MWAGYNRRRAKDRSADAARRRARAAAKLATAVAAYQVPPGPKLSIRRHGFRITVECLDDGARSCLVTLRTPFGLTVPPALVGRKVACVLREYLPAASLTPAAGLCLLRASGGCQGKTKTPTGGGVGSLQPSTR